jgi:hypothetical protein
MIFSLIWLLSLIEYLNNFIIISSAVSYYWINRCDDDPDIPDKEALVLEATCLAYFKHFGSITFGAFVIAVIRFIKYTVVALAIKTKSWTGDADGGCVKVLQKCAICCLDCAERITDYINESAFSYIAVTGDSFCAGALNSFMLQLEYLFEFGFAALIAKAFIFLGKCAVMFGNCLSLYAIMKYIT